jgi:hypothetical protein
LSPYKYKEQATKGLGHASRIINDRCLHQKNPIPTYFDPKYLGNTLEILLNKSIITKKPKNNPKTRNPPGTKILHALRYVVLGVLKVKQNSIYVFSSIVICFFFKFINNNNNNF